MTSREVQPTVPLLNLRQRASRTLFTILGLWMVGLGLYFIFVRPALLPEDVRYIGLAPAAIEAQLPGLQRWLGHVFIVMGGFMAGAGVLTLHLARSGLWERRSTLLAAAVSGALTVLLMSAINFAIDSDFRWVLLLPVGLWAVGLGLSLSVRQRS